MLLAQILLKKERIEELEIIMDQFPDDDQMSPEMFEEFTRLADEHATLKAELLEAGVPQE
jgi:hypothetical protein